MPESDSFNCLYAVNESARTPHFSLHFRAVQPAYICADGYEFARKPTSNGGLGIFCKPSATSVKICLAIVAASTTLHDTEGAESELIAYVGMDQGRA